MDLSKSVAGAVLAGFAAGAAAQDSTVQDLQQRLAIVERQLAIQKEEAESRVKDATSASAGEKGFSLKKGDFELKFNLLAQVDQRWFLADSNAQRLQEGLVLRRLRPIFQGSLGKLVSFRLTPEFAGNGSGLGGTGANGSAASIVDAYFDLKFDPAASVRIGKQKGPVGLERLQSGGAISFIERGYVTELVPNHDIGAALYGVVLGSTLNYTVGVFNGTNDGRDIASVDADNRREIEARLFAEPFRNAPGVLQYLGFGIGGSTGTQIGGNVPQYRSPGQNVFFTYNAAGAAAAGTHTRLSPQFYWYYNSLGLLGEYATSKQALTRTGAASPESFTNKGYEVTATYLITGEDETYKGPVKPRTPYTVGGAGWGALEVAARTGALSIDDDAFANGFAAPGVGAQQRAQSFAAGVNWYPTVNAKVVLDFDFTRFNPAPGATARRDPERALFTRLQITY